LSDEILMAYVDGALTPDVRKRVGDLLAEHPEFQDRIRIFEATGRAIGLLFEDMISRAATPAVDRHERREVGIPHAGAGDARKVDVPHEETANAPAAERSLRRPRRTRGLGSAAVIGQSRIIVTT
jgi:anti-sigma factor RsiW